MQILTTSDPRPHEGLALPPGLRFGADDSADGVFYRPASIFPSDLPALGSPSAFASDTSLDVVAIRVADIIEKRPDIVLLEHPRLDVLGRPTRRTPGALQFFEQYAFSPLRQALGRDAVIVQFGIDADDTLSCPSLDASLTLYDPDKAEAYADGSLFEDRGRDLPEERFVWIPAARQWAGGVHWRPDQTRDAIEAVRDRGATPIVWFDPKKWGLPDYERLMTLACYHLGWPCHPREFSGGEQMQQLLQHLAAEGYTFESTLDLLAQWSKAAG